MSGGKQEDLGHIKSVNRVLRQNLIVTPPVKRSSFSGLLNGGVSTTDENSKNHDVG